MHNEKFKGVNPTNALLRAYSRYATSIPDHIKAVLDLQPVLKAKFQALSYGKFEMSNNYFHPLWLTNHCS